MDRDTNQTQMIPNAQPIRDLQINDWPEIWCFTWFREHPDAKLGDYGYIHPETKLFVQLGNVSTLFQRRKMSDWSTRAYVDVATECTSDNVWNEGTWRYVFPVIGEL